MLSKRLHRHVIALLAVLTLFVSLSANAVADWPTYLHDNSRVGATDQPLPKQLTLQWVFHSPVSPRLAWEGPRSEPIEGKVMKHRVGFDDAYHVTVAGDRAYFASTVEHVVYCVDRETGKTLWRFFTEGPVRLAPTLNDGLVYIGSDDGLVYCLNGENGKVVWKHRVAPKDERLLARGQMISRWPIRTSVLIDGGVAYFGAGIFPHETVYLAAADAKTGNILWKEDAISQQDAGRNDLSPQGYLLADEKLLFVPSGRTLPAAFEKSTGEFVFKKSYGWRNSAGGVVGGAKAMIANGQLYSAGANHFLGLDDETGSAGAAFIKGRQMTFRGELAYVLTGDKLIAVNQQEHAKASVERKNLYAKLREYRSNPDKLAKANARMIELENAGIQWEQPFTGDGALVLAGNAVVAGGNEVVKVFDIEKGTLLHEAKVDGDTRGLAIANGHLFVSTNAGKVYAYAAGVDQPPAIWPENYSKSPYPNDELTAIYETAARDILENSKVDSGFCLVLGSQRGRLAYELAKRAPKLTLICLEQDEALVQQSQNILTDAGLYGHRIKVFHAAPDKSPLSNYFANLVVSDSMLIDGKLPVAGVELGRFLKPCGGVVCLGYPAAATKKTPPTELASAIAELYLRDDAKSKTIDNWVVLERGKLAGAGEWSHQYGSAANTSLSEDHRIKGSLGVLWYGDPGPSQMINRHEAASAPLSTNGRFFVQGTDNIRAYDAYNGEFLWEHKNPGAIRTGVFNNYETSNLAASDDALFVAVGKQCTVYDAATGKVNAELKAPQSDDGIDRDWGYLAFQDDLVYGTSTIRTELEKSLRRRGRTIGSKTDAIFSYSPKTGELAWKYTGQHIMHVTITIGDGLIYFVESSISQEQRDALLRQDKTALKDLPPEEAKKKEAELKKYDVRMAVALNAKTGEEVWRKAVDVTNCTKVGAGGGNLALMYTDGKVVLCGANANGHYWRQFLGGDFSQRRLVVLDANTGEKKWSKDANYMNRPVIVGTDIIAEPWAFNVETGEPKKRVNPLTGEVSNWQFSRPGHHCGIITSTPNMMFFRSGFIGYYDMYEDSGTRHFAGQRLGCWVNAIPANGVVVIPEASAGCVCLFSITSTVVLEPREDREAAWGIYSVSGNAKPVRNLSINLAAPGDRRDSEGKLWLGYPRPRTVGRMEFVLKLNTTFATGGEYYKRNMESVAIQGSQTQWLHASGARGLSRCEIPLRGKNDGPKAYTVSLHFAELEDYKAGDATFNIKLQGKVVAESVDIVRDANGVNKAVVKVFQDVNVEESLLVELVPNEGAKLPPLSAIDIDEKE